MSLNGKNVCPALLITLGTPIFMFCVTNFCSTENLMLYLRAPTMLGTYVRYDGKWLLVVYGCEMSLNGKNICPALLITLGTPYFYVLCDGLLFDGKTTAISKSRYQEPLMIGYW